MKIAIISYDKLGGSIAYLLFAENLRINHYDVTLFSDSIIDLENYLNTKIKKFSQFNFKDYDIIISDYVSPLFKNANALKYELIARKCFIIGMKNIPEKIIKLNKELSIHVLKKFNTCNFIKRIPGNIVLDNKESTINNTIESFSKRIGLNNTTPQVYASYLGDENVNNKIAIFPFASSLERTWKLENYISLSNYLIELGYEIDFIIEKKNNCKLTYYNKQLHILSFSSLLELSVYLKKTIAIISTDTGASHLGTILKVPTYTIIMDIKNSNHWLPGGKKSKFVHHNKSIDYIKNDLYGFLK